MPSRFEFERAIRRSGLPPLARLLALTIATWADAETGSISLKNQPAQSVLLEATGMSKVAFLTHRKTLVGDGWLKCVSPDRVKAQKEHAQNVYSILIPDGKAGSPGDRAQPGEVGHDSVWARSPSDRAQSDENRTSPDQARSPSDLGLGRLATQPKTDDVGNAPEKLGRSATTRVFPSSVSPLLPLDEGGQDSSSYQDRIPDAFAYIQPLIAAMTDAGFSALSWQMHADEMQSIARVLRRAGVSAMVESALSAKSRARKSIGFATYFLKSGWAGLPPKSTKPRPAPAAEKPPWCEDPDCDPISRTRDIENDRGLRFSQPCAKCHPARKAPAA
jgi:hypothetical protein